MTFVRPHARILEISITPGHGPFALNGAADNSYNTFASFMSIGDMTEVAVVEPGVAFWSGIGTYSAANEITLTSVEETKGIFGLGTKEIMASRLASSAALSRDITGAIVTGGTSAAYTVASFRKYNTLAELDGAIIAFTPHITNTLGSPHVSLIDGASLGAAGGVQSRTLSTANLPPYTPSGTITNGAISLSQPDAIRGDTGGGGIGGGGNFGHSYGLSASQGASTFTGNAQGGTSTAFGIVPPTIVCNYIMRVL